MSEEKPIFKCIDAKTHSKNNWYDNLTQFIKSQDDLDFEKALELDRAKLAAMGMIEEIKDDSQQLKADIMRRTIAVLQEPKYEDYKTKLTNWLSDSRGCYADNGQ